jgi:hypothetical protein
MRKALPRRARPHNAGRLFGAHAALVLYPGDARHPDMWFGEKHLALLVGHPSGFHENDRGRWLSGDSHFDVEKPPRPVCIYPSAASTVGL